MRIHVKARPPLARHCRCGMCFDAEGYELKADSKELAALRADPWLIVTECEAGKADKSEGKPEKDDGGNGGGGKNA